MIQASPPRWSEDQFQQDLDTAIEAFRARRLKEPVQQYREDFDRAADRVKDLLERTDNLTDMAPGELATASELLADPQMRAALRYMAGPPISEDDLKTLADASSLAPSRLRGDSDLVRRVMDVLRAGLDVKRFPWTSQANTPDESELHAAVVASASLMASQHVQTARRNSQKDEQEGRVKRYLRLVGLTEVAPRPIPTIRDAPGPGEFCGECRLGRRKADIVVGLRDGRGMPIECKVSNSALNSVKRLNNDAAAKAAHWIVAFGQDQAVPSAVLAGVFKLHNLMAAQQAGLTIFWSHKLKPLGQFVR